MNNLKKQFALFLACALLVLSSLACTQLLTVRGTVSVAPELLDQFTPEHPGVIFMRGPGSSPNVLGVICTAEAHGEVLVVPFVYNEAEMGSMCSYNEISLRSWIQQMPASAALLQEVPVCQLARTRLGVRQNPIYEELIAEGQTVAETEVVAFSKVSQGCHSESEVHILLAPVVELPEETEQETEQETAHETQDETEVPSPEVTESDVTDNETESTQTGE